MAGYMQSRGVDAIITRDGEEENNPRPYCEHGPAVLFERFFAGKPSRRYFACSACRERRDCPFFQWEDDRTSDGKKLLQEKIKRAIAVQAKKRTTVKPCTEWCLDCSSTIKKTSGDEHETHNRKVLTGGDLKHPTQVLGALNNKKTNAQFFFSTASCNFLLDTIKRQKFKKVLCIGTPKLFEALQSQAVPVADSLLMDIDHRFASFYDTSKYIRYNMFNNFFFDGRAGEEALHEFLATGNEGEEVAASEVLFVIDPPFGGLATLLADSIRKLSSQVASIRGTSVADNLNPATILVFPYFLEAHVSQNMESLHRTDYKVTYVNHPHYHSDIKKGSPVRLFTNIQADKFFMPREEGYRFCKLCKRYVSKENEHCETCKSCPSKDGRTYVHCNACQSCVKPGREHCDVCKSCELPAHDCNRQAEAIGCHICGDSAHKRRDCPRKNTSSSETVSGGSIPRKRKRTTKGKGVKRPAVVSAPARLQKKKNKKKKLIV